MTFVFICSILSIGPAGLLKLKHMIAKLKNYLLETKTELKRVTWPSRQDTIKHTLAVIGISVAVAAFLGALDILFQFLLEKFIL
ncbi:MAG: hypothetical protein G01um101470_676 [Parcubacteria group bacterium Gr01-1014_70]|nr:MAG: hypothetical protein G01um101470_676 [Parcubacteria group bacterium Gr01-1014_70]